MRLNMPKYGHYDIHCDCGTTLRVRTRHVNAPMVNSEKCPACGARFTSKACQPIEAVWIKGEPSEYLLLRRWAQLSDYASRLREAGQESGDFDILADLLEKEIQRRRDASN